MFRSMLGDLSYVEDIVIALVENDVASSSGRRWRARSLGV